MKIQLRAVTGEDAVLLFEWRNDPTTRRNAFSGDPLEMESHIAWLNHRLAEPDVTRIWIAETVTGEPVGQIRFDREERNAIIDYTVAPGWRGKGLGIRLLELGARRISSSWPDLGKLIGRVKADNQVSIECFERALYTGLESNGEIRFTLPVTERRCIIVANRPWYWGIAERVMERVPVECELWTDRDDLKAEALRAKRPHWVFFPHWSWLIPAEVYDHFNCVVFHMTDLPFGRGGTPLQNLIARGFDETKISAIDVVEGLDAGDVYLKRPLSLHGSAQEIFERSAAVIEDMMVEIITQDPRPEPQEGEVVPFERRTPADSAANRASGLDEIYDLIRMLDADGYPRAFLETANLRVEFSHASRQDGRVRAEVMITERQEDS